MRKVLIFCALALLCALPALGAEVSVPGLDQIWAEADSCGVNREASLDDGLSGLFATALDQIGGLFQASLATAMKLVAVVLLCALAESARAGEETALQGVTLAGVLAITALTLTDMDTMIGLGRDTLGRMESFSALLLPAMAVLTAATGGVTAAAARQGATVLFSQLLIAVMDRLLVPLVYAFVAASCAYAAVGNPGMKKVAELLKSAVTFLLVLALCLTPFLRLAMQYLVYKGAAALCATVAQPKLSGLIDAIGSAFGLVLGMTGAGALVLLVSIVSAVSAVTP